MACLERFTLSKKNMAAWLSLAYPSKAASEENCKTSGTMYFIQMKPNQTGLKTKLSISAPTAHTSCRVRWWRDDHLGLFSTHKSWVPGSHWVDHELFWTPKYCRVKYEVISVTGIKSTMMPNTAANLQQNVYKRKLAVLQWPTESPDRKLTAHKQMSTNLNALNFREE